MAGTAQSRYCADVHRFRGIAIALVVFSHALVISKSDPIGNVVHETTVGSTWPFVFVSGYLFALLFGKYPYAEYLRNKARNVFLPDISVVSFVIILGLERISGQGPLDIINHYFLGHTAVGTFWFIPMILLFFCASPAFNWRYRRPELLVLASVGFVLIAVFKGRPHPFSGAIFNALYSPAFIYSG